MISLAHRILVADDEPEILLEMTAYLRRRGHIVLDASSMSEAKRVYLEGADSIALVVTDMTMPDGSGCDLARLVHGRSKGQCPCLIISGNFDSKGLPADLGVAGVLSLAKPFSLSMFYGAVLTIMHGPGAMSIAGLGASVPFPARQASI